MSFTGTNRLSGTAIAAAKASETEARFHELLKQNAAALGRLAAAYTRSASDRDDLLQEIATALWQALPGFRGECSARTFLFRIAHNRAIAFLARSRTARDIENDEFEAPDPNPSAEEPLIKRESGQQLLEAVRTLPIAYREAVVLMLEGFEYAGIAEVIGISETNVGARLTRARQILRKKMEGFV